ncbi:MAG: 4Fe-4S binding protein [Chloroflexi bacterium]|nr:4Fe-4S binding protein [Chloroflexota bacterium]
MTAVVPQVDSDKCGGCGDCVQLCPAHAVGLVGGKAVIVRPEDCDYCADCEGFCPSSAINCPFEIVLEKPDHRA